MSFNIVQLNDKLEKHDAVVRIVVAQTNGSTPREVGASMLVWEGGHIGTIGGGELELQAINCAQKQLVKKSKSGLQQYALGPALGQCCGGSVAVLFERFTPADLVNLAQINAFIRPARVGSPRNAPFDEVFDVPLAVQRVLDRMRAQGQRPKAQLLSGWMIEPISHPSCDVWIYGAGHVGRALVNVLAPLPDLAICWIDTAADRYPETMPSNVTALPTITPANAVAMAPAHAHHLVLTYSHAMDLEICNAIAARPFASAGLIGSATKWARFQKRLRDLGHSQKKIDRIQCPIGLPSLGKHPQAIAVGVASRLIETHSTRQTSKKGILSDRKLA